MSKLEEEVPQRRFTQRKRRTNEGQDFQERRHNRIDFKNYLRQLEEEQLEDELDLELMQEDDPPVEDEK